MDGQPVWLCSVSHMDRRTGQIKATGKWDKEEVAMAERLAHSALKGVGDPARERAFRMNITFCIHRAVSDAEKAAMPRQWDAAPGWLAGGPIEILWSRGIQHRPAAMPCVSPTKVIIEPSRPDLWFPEDCGECEPCLARAAIVAQIDGVTPCRTASSAT